MFGVAWRFSLPGRTQFLANSRIVLTFGSSVFCTRAPLFSGGGPGGVPCHCFSTNPVFVGPSRAVFLGRLPPQPPSPGPAASVWLCVECILSRADPSAGHRAPFLLCPCSFLSLSLSSQESIEPGQSFPVRTCTALVYKEVLFVHFY